MRELKFRAWHKRLKEMRPVYYFTVRAVYTYSDPLLNSGGWKREDVVLMQYTGLKDKNGKEIYEGDIVHTDKKKDSNFGGRDFEVRWNADRGSYGMYDGDTFSLVTYAYESMMRDCKVIGDIYTTPELLK